MLIKLLLDAAACMLFDEQTERIECTKRERRTAELVLAELALEQSFDALVRLSKAAHAHRAKSETSTFAGFALRLRMRRTRSARRRERASAVRVRFAGEEDANSCSSIFEFAKETQEARQAMEEPELIVTAKQQAKVILDRSKQIKDGIERDKVEIASEGAQRDACLREITQLREEIEREYQVMREVRIKAEEALSQVPDDNTQSDAQTSEELARLANERERAEKASAAIASVLPQLEQSVSEASMLYDSIKAETAPLI